MPIYLVQRGIAVQAIAGEVNKGPFLGAERNVRSHGLKESISVRHGNGLAVLTAGEVDAITVSGMGGGTIREILANGIDKLEGVARLILSPQGDGDSLRRWLIEHGWQIVEEDMLEEDDKIYEIVVAERGEMVLADPLALEFGPLLLQRKHPLILARAEYELSKITLALKGLENARGESGQARRDALQQRRKQLEEVQAHVRS